MGVYNGSKRVKAAIGSILNQTFTDFEMIVCDDGSTDNSVEIIKELAAKDNRIILLQNQKNMQLAATLNKCLNYAQGEYIARMDDDDISHPERLRKQVDFLDSHPEYVLVSSYMALFDENGKWGVVKVAEKPQPINFLMNSPFIHAACMIRKNVLLKVNGYNERKQTLRVEDYDLWFRIYAEGYRGYNLQEVLYECREDRQAYLRRKYIYRINEAYVKFIGFHSLKLPLWSYIFVLKPLIIGLIPISIYGLVRKNLYGEV